MPDPSPAESRYDAGRRISRGPVIVLIVGAALAVSLVLLGAELAAAGVSNLADDPTGLPFRW